VAAGDLLFPALVLKESALENNLRVMAGYARDHGFELAPHGKTTMAPELFRRQLEAGAWGITVANVAQASVAFGAGAARVLVANEIVGTADASWVVEAVGGGDHELVCLVDSVYGVGLLDRNLARAGLSGRLGVLVELGLQGGRTGARREHDVLEVVAAVSSSAHLRLVGVEGYEGGIATDRSAESLASVDLYLGAVRRTVRMLADRGAFEASGAVLVSAGGSKYFDRVAEILGPPADYGGHAVRLIARPGCYVSHDHGMYEAVSPLASSRSAGPLRPALELWAEVLSIPEDGLAIVGLGKRDTSFDFGLPVPLHIARHASPAVEVFTDGALTGLDDQHGYLRLGPGLGPAGVLPGDRVGFGLSHPCTAFDKWGTVLLVDDGYIVRHRIRTYFH
jgi:D-serine deaminase-like pyridoxal phosphate-dependent protein